MLDIFFFFFFFISKMVVVVLYICALTAVKRFEVIEEKLKHFHCICRSCSQTKLFEGVRSQHCTSETGDQVRAQETATTVSGK